MNVEWLGLRCRRCRQQMALQVCGMLPPTEQTAMEAHRSICRPCQGHWAEMETLARHLRQLPHHIPAAQPSLGLRTNWTRVIQAENRQPHNGWIEWARARWAGLAWWERPTMTGLAGIWLLILACNLTAPSVPYLGQTTPCWTSQQILAILRSDTNSWSQWVRSSRLRSSVTDPPGALKPRSQREAIDLRG